MTDAGDLQAKLKALNDAYAAQLPDKLNQLELVWVGIPSDGWSEASFESLHRMVHGLSGSGGSFGFSALSSAARLLEDFLKQLIEAKSPLGANDRARIQDLLGGLRLAAVHRDVPDMPGIVRWARSGVEPKERQRVMIVEDDRELTAVLKLQLTYFGYDISTFNSLAEFRVGIEEQPDTLVVMDVSFPEDEFGGITVMKEMQQRHAAPPPAILVSTRDEFEIRLEAVRAGALAFLTKPVDIGDLIDKLDVLTTAPAPAQFRILIIDDDLSLSAYYATVLERAGMLAKVINNPLLAMNALREFLPDLILLDIYMPECTGLELAKVIRQSDDFVGIPIIFLSIEDKLDRQLFAMGLGGDDFLNKPIESAHLVAAVTNRVRRSQTLRSFMVRDSLTGLLNHTAIKDQLDRQMAQATRRKAPLSFAMLDIDYFKAVNDTYGHPVGDRVIKSLSRLLKQRLRKTDSVGRYGGEEFAVILSDADATAAARIMDSIREDFSKLQHHAGDCEFFVTFSCGIADTSCADGNASLCEEADKALYRAKHAGRNQIKWAESA